MGHQETCCFKWVKYDDIHHVPQQENVQKVNSWNNDNVAYGDLTVNISTRNGKKTKAKMIMFVLLIIKSMQ